MNSVVRRSVSILGFVPLLLAAIFAGGLCLAQVDTGEITGTLTDSSGGVLSGVQVSIVNTATGAKTNAVTSARGQFVSPPLRPGTYSVTAEAPGFRKSVTTVTLGLNERVEANMALQLGLASEEVTIKSDAPLLQSESSTVGGVVDEQAIQDLPMNVRNINELVGLAPGVVPGDTQSATVALTSVRGETANSVNGLTFRSNRYLVDGIDNSDNHNGRGIVLYPPVDAILEFGVQTSSMNAEFGRGGGGAINVYYKTGSNQIHGDVFEYLRNSALDARNFFATTPSTPPFRMNQFGGTVGGPIRRNKAFYFFSYEGQRRRQAQPYNVSVPLPAYKTGDFSSYKNKIYDPLTTVPSGNSYTRTPFAGNIIPASRIDKVGQALINLYPNPNEPGTSANYATNPSQSLDSNAFDIKVDPSLGPRDQTFFRYSHHGADQVVPGSLPLPAVGGNNNYASSRYPLQQFVASYTHTISPNMVNEFRAGFTRLRIESLPLNSGKNISDALGIPGVNQGSDPTHSGLSQFTLSGFQSLGDAANAPAILVSENYQENDNLTWTKGNHTFKFGGEVTRRHYNWFQYTATHGLMGFGPTYTTQPSAPTNTGLSLADLLLGAPTSGSIDNADGTRGYRRTELGVYAQDTWRITQSLTLNYGVRYDLFLGYPWSEVAGRLTNFRTDLGNAFVVGSQQVPQASGTHTNYKDFGPRLGISYKLAKKTLLRMGGGMFYSADQISAQNLGGANPPFVGSFAFTNSQSDFLGARPLSAGFTRPGNLVFSTAGANLYGIDPNFKTPYAFQWNAGIQRSVSQSTVVTVSYVGTTGKHLMVTPDINQPTPGPGAIAARRPYPNFGSVSIFQAEGSSIYHSLQVTALKRLSHNLNFQTSYTYSHAIDNGDFQSVPQDRTNLAAERGNGVADLRHRLVVSWTYSLPFLTHNRYLGGWQISGLANFYTGTPFTPTSSINTLNATGTQRANRIGSGALANPTVQEYFNIADFTTPATYKFGNSGRDILFGPGTKQVDASALKNFYFRDDRRWRLQFRAELFNITNTPQLNNPNASIGGNGAGQITTAGSPATFQRTSREIQFALKLYW